MSDLIGVGISGLKAAQAALDTTMHNITNVATEGYSRQTVQLTAQTPQYTGVGYLGNGVQVSDITRISNQFIVDSLNDANSLASQASAYSDIATQVDNLMSDPSVGVSDSLNKFYSAIENLQSDPSSIPARQVMLTRAQILASRVNELNSSIQSQVDTINNNIQTAVANINSYGVSIANLNESIVASLGATGGLSPPNDLLDQRDQQILQLAELVGLSTLSEDDGSISVFLGKNQTFVLEGNAFAIGTTPNLNDASLLDITYGTNPGAPVITSNITGGSLGGWYSVRSELVDQLQNGIDRIAAGLSSFFNTQHQQGIDLTGKMGTNLFADINTNQSLSARAAPLATNFGDGVLELTLTNVGQLETDNYTLNYDGTYYRLIDSSTNIVSQQTTSLAAITGLGFSLQLASGTIQAGDNFSIRPVLDAAELMACIITDPRQLALASPIRLTANEDNTGVAELSNLLITNATGLPVPTAYVYGNAFSTPYALTPPIEIRFTSSTTFQIYDMTTSPGIQIGPAQAYSPGNSIFPLANVVDNTPPGPNPNYIWDPGFEIAITGTPAAGDVYDITFNTGGVMDNQNASLLLNIRNDKNMLNGTASITDVYAQLVGTVGSLTESAIVSDVANQGLLSRVQEQQGSISGVSIDEEAGNLIKFQQAYEAAARVIAIARDTFNTLLSAVGGT